MQHTHRALCSPCPQNQLSGNVHTGDLQGFLTGISSQNHRMAWVRRNLKGLVPSPLPEAGAPSIKPRCSEPPIQLGLEHSQEWGIHSFSGRPVQGLIPLTANNFVLRSTVNPLSLSLKLLLLALPPSALVLCPQLRFPSLSSPHPTLSRTP